MTGILAVLLSFSLFVLTHWAICRYLRWRPLSPVLNVTWLCFLPIYAIVFFLLSQKVPALAIDVRTVDGVATFLNGLLLNVFFLLGYTVFFFLIERGLSLRVVIEIHRSPQGRMTIEEIKRVYTYDYILEKRLGQMLKMGYAIRKGDYICSTERAARLIAANRLVRKVFRIEQVMP
jgi:hypothetical protein